FPDTRPKGAWTVADDVCLQLKSTITPPVCKVLTYPGTGPAAEAEGRDASSEVDSSDRPAEAMEVVLMSRIPAWKRALDIVGAGVGLLVLSPLLLAVAVAIKLTCPGPVFFRQRRSGEGGRPFEILKFRTMVVNAEQLKKRLMAINEQDGPAFKIKNDPRITP